MPLIITSFVNSARCRPPIGYRCRSSWPVRSQVNTVTGDCQLHHRRICIDFSFPAALAVFTRFFLKSWFTTTDPPQSYRQADEAIVGCEGVWRRPFCESRFYIWPLPSRKSLRQWKKGRSKQQLKSSWQDYYKRHGRFHITGSTNAPPLKKRKRKLWLHSVTNEIHVPLPISKDFGIYLLTCGQKSHWFVQKTNKNKLVEDTDLMLG